ncbi:hypothetical protein SK803_33680 [Lentzea sp. BCCO 10_0856]|uniref:Secreted protein n=1 Tax=Lentzea miocenica TaxID=3095431 RepID=A0ABU4TAJ3_9PSEU|nr:hypothetical protein [Lentzea sp. BCCO 10_0856]MDX8035190.1 hypothetical protein [Lentzea sp. BCCO 10_0856]
MLVVVLVVVDDVVVVVVVVVDVGSVGLVGVFCGGSSVVTVVVVPSGRVMVVTRVDFFVVVVALAVVVSGTDDDVTWTDEVGADVGTMLRASRTASLRGGCVDGVSLALSEPAAREATAAKTVASTTPDAARTTCGAPRKKRDRESGSGLSYTKFPLLNRQKPKFWVQ